MYDDSDKNFFKKIFRDVCQGYTIVNYKKKDVFIKHVKDRDLLFFEETIDKLNIDAQKRGIPSRESRKKTLIESGEWLEKDDTFILSQENYINSLRNTKNEIIIKSEKEKIQKLIDEELNVLSKKRDLLEALIGETSEIYSNKVAGERFIYDLFHKDSLLTQKFFTKDEFEDLPRSAISDLTKINNSFVYIFSEKNIQSIILQDFFIPYMYVSDNPKDLFGEPLVNLTSNQLILCLYQKVFKNIIDQHPDMPEDVRKDPEKLLAYSAESKSREKAKENLQKEGASTVFGASESDYNDLGISSEELSIKKPSLHQAAAKKGGSLNMDDLMKMQGL